MGGARQAQAAIRYRNSQKPSLIDAFYGLIFFAAVVAMIIAIIVGIVRAVAG